MLFRSPPPTSGLCITSWALAIVISNVVNPRFAWLTVAAEECRTATRKAFLEDVATGAAIVIAGAHLCEDVRVPRS